MGFFIKFFIASHSIIRVQDDSPDMFTPFFFQLLMNHIIFIFCFLHFGIFIFIPSCKDHDSQEVFHYLRRVLWWYELLFYQRGCLFFTVNYLVDIFFFENLDVPLFEIRTNVPSTSFLDIKMVFQKYKMNMIFGKVFLQIIILIIKVQFKSLKSPGYLPNPLTDIILIVYKCK